MSKSKKHFTAQQEGLGEINGHIEEVYSGHNVVKAYNGGKAAKETFEEINETLYDSGWKSQFLSGLMMPIIRITSYNVCYTKLLRFPLSLAAAPNCHRNRSHFPAAERAVCLV